MRAVRSGPWGAGDIYLAPTSIAASSSTSVRTLSTLISLILASDEQLVVVEAR
jgi:hypothetical protein